MVSKFLLAILAIVPALRGVDFAPINGSNSALGLSTPLGVVDVAANGAAGVGQTVGHVPDYLERLERGN